LPIAIDLRVCYAVLAGKICRVHTGKVFGGTVTNQIPTASYRLKEEHIRALQQLGKQAGRRGASEALREILDGNADTLAALRAELGQTQQSERLSA
jgi:hypothetical protein